MSIRPEFATRLLSGEKRAEFRRRPATRNVTHILIYATSPVCAVVGVAEIEGIEHGTPQTLWRAFRLVGGIGRSDFFQYFENAAWGCAYVVRRTWSCASPIRLGRKGLPLTAPQAFQYVHPSTLQAVLNGTTGNARRSGSRGDRGSRIQLLDEADKPDSQLIRCIGEDLVGRKHRLLSCG
jgi:predicted transcriptional regulator